MEEKPDEYILAPHQMEWLKEVDVVGSVLESMLNRFHEEPEIDEFWLSQGRTQLQQGLMAVRRAITKPRTF
jgi:hypothetical protein